MSAAPALVVDPETGQVKVSKYKTVSEMISDAGTELSNLYSDAETFMLGMGDDVTKKVLKNYFAFRRIKNFALRGSEDFARRGAALPEDRPPAPSNWKRLHP